MLGTALREQGDLPGARASLQRAIALLPPTAAVFVDLAITYLRAGDLPKAIGQLAAGLNLPAPAVPAPDYGAAVAALKAAIEGRPRRCRGAQRPRLAARPDGSDAAVVAAEFREAIRLRPDYAEAHNNLGLVLIQTGDDPGGIASLREAVRIAPEYADARANLGAALTLTDVDESIRELEKAVELAPGSVKAHFNLAVAYGASPKHGSAKELEQLRKVIELAPAFHRAHLALGKALLKTGQAPRRRHLAAGSRTARPEERRSELPAGPRPRARRAQGRSRGRPEARSRAGGARRPESERQPRHRRGPGGARERRAGTGRRPASPRRAGASGLGRRPATARQGTGETGERR